jgi:hypothetical protein
MAGYIVSLDSERSLGDVYSQWYVRYQDVHPKQKRLEDSSRRHLGRLLHNATG